MKKLYFASDHAGFELKSELTRFAKSLGIEVEDLGCHSSESVDYPEYAAKLTERVLAEAGSGGVLICGTGIGMSIAANRRAGIRAALCCDPETAAMSRMHNNSNVLALGARRLDAERAREIFRAWNGAEFEGGRHQRRIDRL